MSSRYDAVFCKCMDSAHFAIEFVRDEFEHEGRGYRNGGAAADFDDIRIDQ